MSIDVYLSHVDIYSAKLSIDDSIFLLRIYLDRSKVNSEYFTNMGNGPVKQMNKV